MFFVYSWSSFVAISSTGQPTDEGQPKNELKSWSNVGEKKFFLPTPNDFNKLAKIKTIPIVSCTRHSYLASQNGNMRCTTYKIDKKKETQAELHMHKKKCGTILYTICLRMYSTKCWHYRKYTAAQYSEHPQRPHPHTQTFHGISEYKYYFYAVYSWKMTTRNDLMWVTIVTTSGCNAWICAIACEKIHCIELNQFAQWNLV